MQRIKSPTRHKKIHSIYVTIKIGMKTTHTESNVVEYV